ncbi:hypothetical protein MPSEU_000101700 [Mayamaea pseudoterrestris]|nr:hypothetical protein MPSEU_000101700 [Mayamaea pseudoterrestris]
MKSTYTHPSYRIYTPAVAPLQFSACVLFMFRSERYQMIRLGALTFALLHVKSLSFQPIRMSQLQPLGWQGSSSHLYSVPVPTMTFSSVGDDDEDNVRFSSFSPSNSPTSYLPDAAHLPPRTKDLLTQLSKSYIYSTRQRPVTLEQVLQVIEAEHFPIDVPIVLGSRTIDVKQTGEDVDESVAEIFSLAAMYALPKEVTLHLLDSCILGAEQGDAKSELQRCRDIYADKGWSAVSFPKGLALQIIKKYEPRQQSKKKRIDPFYLLRRQKRRVEQASQAILRASTTIPPKKRLESRQDFYRTMEEELFDAKSGSRFMVDSNKNLFFPGHSVGDSMRRGFRKVTRTMDKQYARLKGSGRAGIVSYCFLNLVFYTVGVVWQWQRFATPVNPLHAPSVSTVLLKKFAKVFGSLYVASQFTKLPKVVAAVALTPVAQRIVNSTKKNFRVSETVATVMLVGMQYVVWLGIVMIPILSEYSSLRRLVELEKLVDIRQVAPAFYTVARMGLLQEC